MKKIYLSLFFSALLSFVFNTSFSQTITLGSLGTTSFCPSGSLAVPFTTDLPAGTVFRVYLSNSSGSFSFQTQIGQGMVSPITVSFPTYLSAGTNYKLKIMSATPAITSNLSINLVTNGEQMIISVKNIVGKEIDDAFICKGSSLTSIINVNQIGGSYQWEKDGIVQVNNQSLRITESGTYTAKCQKIGCNSIVKSLNINTVNSASSKVVRMGNIYQCTGSSIVFRNRYFSDSANYQWKRNGFLLSGETKDTLITNQTGKYSVNVTDKCIVLTEDSTYSTPLDSVVFSTLLNNQIRTIRNGNQLCGSKIAGYAYSTTYFDFNSNNLAPYSYQWKKNGLNIQNETDSKLYSIQTEGIYTMALTQGNCTVLSNAINFIKVDTIKLSLALFTTSISKICEGMQTSISIFKPYEGINIDVYKDNILINHNTISNSINVSSSGKYTVRGNALGCVIIPSDTLKIDVGNNLSPLILKNDNYICNNNPAVIQLIDPYSNLPNVSYQWFRDEQLISNETDNTIVTTIPGIYKIRVSSSYCSGYSDTVSVISSLMLPKPIIYEVGDLPIKSLKSNCQNNVIKVYSDLKISLPNNSFTSTQWNRNGQIISTKFLNDNELLIPQSGIYTVIGKKGDCISQESDPVEIKIGEPITANITGSTSIYAGQKVNLNLNFTGGNAWSYQTSDVATSQRTSLSSVTKSVSPTTVKTYTITTVASNCGIGTISGNATITVCQLGKTSSVQSGNWNVPSTWSCGQIPTSAYDTIIENGHTVILPNGYQAETKKLDLRGELTQGTGSGVRVNQ